MKRLTSFFIIGYSLVCFYSCHDTQTRIKGCCEEPPVYETLGLGKVWIPNVFTPNGDGLNDQMIVFGDSMKQILSLVIKNEDKLVVFYGEHLPFNSYVWDGKSFGQIQRGLYSFTLDVEAIDGYRKIFSGHICNCPCDQMSDEDFVPMSNCEFGPCPPNWIDCYPIESLPCFKH
jgi:hypothetical protein